MFSPADANIEQRLADLQTGFDGYVASFNADPPFGSSQLQNHRRTLELLGTFTSAADAARDGGFADSLAETLKSWDIGVQRYNTDLVQPFIFREQLRRISLAVAQLEHLRIDDPTMDGIRVARADSGEADHSFQTDGDHHSEGCRSPSERSDAGLFLSC